WRKGEGSNLKHLSPELVELTNGSPSMLNSILYAVSQRGIQIMRRQFKFYQLSVLALLLLLALTNFSISKAQDKKKNEQVRREGTAVMWREPSDIATALVESGWPRSGKKRSRRLLRFDSCGASASSLILTIWFPACALRVSIRLLKMCALERDQKKSRE